MTSYEVFISPKVHRDLDAIYSYVKDEILEPCIAFSLVSLIEKGILELENFPHKGTKRKVGKYADRGYRQIFIKNYTVIYRIDEPLRRVIVLTVRYSSSCF